MENNIPIAEEFLKSKGLYNDKSIKLQNIGMTISEAMIEFTKLHCESQLKAILENVKINEMKNYSCAMENMIVSDNSFSTENYEYYIDTNSIIKAYNLNNIK
jgi:hypothetical protein